MAKTIADYKMDYEVARSMGDAAGMKEANDGANALRTAGGEAAQVASQDIANTALASARAKPSAAQPEDSASTSDYINQLYDASIKRQLDELAAQEAGVNPYYDTVRNQAAATQTQNKAAFNEYANATGLNVGAGGQAELARQNVYGNAVNAADMAEANAYRDIAAQRGQVQGAGDLQRTQALYDEMTRQQELSQRQQSEELAQRNYAEKTEYSRLEDAAQSLAAIGDFSGYKSLYGWTDEQAAAAENFFKWQQQLALKKASGKSGGGGTTHKPTLTYAQMVEAIEYGQLTPNVLAAYQYYMGTPYGAEQAPQSGGGDTPGMMVSRQWARNKERSPDSAEAQFPTYADYAAAYKEYLSSVAGG